MASACLRAVSSMPHQHAVQDILRCVALQALASDPNFLRVSKGAYSLHCLHPDKEQLVRAPQPKEPKPSQKAAAGTPAASGATPGMAGASTATKAKEAAPMIRVEPKALEVRLCWLA